MIDFSWLTEHNMKYFARIYPVNLTVVKIMIVRRLTIFMKLSLMSFLYRNLALRILRASRTPDWPLATNRILLHLTGSFGDCSCESRRSVKSIHDWNWFYFAVVDVKPNRDICRLRLSSMQTYVHSAKFNFHWSKSTIDSQWDHQSLRCYRASTKLKT